MWSCTVYIVIFTLTEMLTLYVESSNALRGYLQILLEQSMGLLILTNSGGPLNKKFITKMQKNLLGQLSNK
jgi:hypothetical protein